MICGDNYSFEVRIGIPPENSKNGTKLARGAHFKCLLSNTPIDPAYIKSEGVAGRIGIKLMAIVAEGIKGRLYLNPHSVHEEIALQSTPNWKPETPLPNDPRNFWTLSYGLKKYADLFTSRQLMALSTFSELILDVTNKARNDANIAGMPDDGLGISEGGRGATAYAEAISVNLAAAISKQADWCNSLSSYIPSIEGLGHLFSKQSIPMVWDFIETNVFSNSAGNFINHVEWVSATTANSPCNVLGFAMQADAQMQSHSEQKVISTDPPYYDNIAYADLSDFFYVWLRKCLRPIFPDLFATLAAPKIEELVATPYRHGGKLKAESFFMEGMTRAMFKLAEQSHPAFPTTIYYAFKQSATTGVGTGNTGWETFLEGVIRAGFAITGTWPMRTERSARSIGQGTNALASSIILVCRQRDTNAATISRREFIRDLKQELTEAIEVMIGGAEGISPVAPVDLAQAVIGPGMAIFSKYAAVLEADGNAMSVHDALVLINRTVTEGGDDFDADTQFALSWFDEQGWSEGEFGKADVLARAKGTSVAGVADAGVLETGAGKVRLLKWAQYPEDWSPENDNRTPVWEALHQLIRVLNQHGESAAGNLLSRMPERSAAIRQLAYRLYTLCERKGWAEDARAYNELIGSWTAIIAASLDAGHKGEQFGLDQFAE